jgi:hypothetical protein
MNALKIFLLITILGFSIKSHAQKPPKDFEYYQKVEAIGSGIKANDLKILLDSLCSPTFQGRETGQEGQKLAGNYIAKQFSDLGLPKKGDNNTYFQNIQLQNQSWTDLGLKIKGNELKNRVDYFVYPSAAPDLPKLMVKNAVFVGYGVEEGSYNDYKGVSVKGKAVVFYNGEPMGKNDFSLITGNTNRSKWSLDWKRKVNLAKEKGATAVFIIEPKIEETVKKNRKNLSTWGWTPFAVETASPATTGADIPCIFISTNTFLAMVGKKAAKIDKAFDALYQGEKFSPIKFKTKTEVRLDKEVNLLKGTNVVGFIEGSDPEMKKDFILITAHYDHLGLHDNEIYYGADDNASGTSSVIEIARAFTEAKKAGLGPKRTVVCMLVSGEEKGLLGSQFYTEFPLFPLDQTILDINIDMVGRVDKEHKNDANYIYVIGGARTSIELDSITKAMNDRFTKLKLDYTYNDPIEPNHYFERSDHYNFVMKGVPATFFFNGVHDDYHKPTDTKEKIDFNACAKRAQLAFYTAFEIANRPERLIKTFNVEDLPRR